MTLAGLYRPLLNFYIPFLVLYWLLVIAFLIFSILPMPGGISFGPCGGVFVVAILGLTLIQTLWTARLLLHPAREIDNPLELHVPRELLGELYQLVEEIGAERGSPVPHEIRLAVDTIAHVFEEPSGKRILVLGGPALMLLSEKALCGVIAHELGHFAAGDTRLSRIGHNKVSVMACLEQDFARTRLLGWNPLVWVLRGYHRLCFHAWAAHSREREYWADRHEVRQVGKKEAGAALLFLTASERLPWVRLLSIAESFVATQQPLDDLFTEQRRRLNSISPSEWEDALRKELSQKTERFDSHPCLRERLKAIGVSPKKALATALAQSGAPVAERLAAWPGIEKILSRRLMVLCREHYHLKLEMSQIILGGPSRG
jgi:Zn-dependent protease with chaperone function